MHILPAISLASNAKNLVTRLLNGTKNDPGSSSAKNAPALADAKTTHSPADAKNTQAFANLKHTQAFAELNHTPAFSGLKNAPGFSGIQNTPTDSNAQNVPTLADARKVLANAQHTPALADARKVLADAQNAPGFSGIRNIPAASNAQNAPAIADAKKALADAQNTPAIANARKALADAQNAPSLADIKKALADAQNAPGLSNIRNAADFSGAKTAPALANARKAPAFADLLRQAEEAQRANTGHSPAIRQHTLPDLLQDARQDIRDRMPSLAREFRHEAETKNSPHNIPQDDPRPYIRSARQTADADGKTQFGRDVRQHIPQQNLSQETLQRLLPETHQDLNPGPQQYTPLEKAPIAPHTANGVHYRLGEVGFTQQELARLRDKLLGEGLSPKTLSVIEQLASHPHGATLGQLLALVNDSLLQKISLSDSDKMNLQYFADKLDPGGAFGKNLVQLLENGQSREAWDALKSAIATVRPQDGPLFEQWEAALLCKLFGASQGASLEVLKQFGNAEALPLTPEIFTAIMVPAQQEILDKFQQNEKLGPALAKHLQPLIEEARLRSEKERKAAEGMDRRSKHAETLIREKFMDNFRKDVATPKQDEAPAARNVEAFGNRAESSGRKDENGHGNRADRKEESRQAETHARKAEAEASGKQAEAINVQEEQRGKTEHVDAKAPPAREDAPAPRYGSTAAAAAKTPDDAHASPKSASVQEFLSRAETDEGKNPQRPREDGRGGHNENGQDARRDSQALLSRLEVRPPAQAAATPGASAFTVPVQPQDPGAGQPASPAPFFRQALQQVEQGTLGRLANGGQRLELQLAPSELGAVTLILTSAKSGEISAIIRSERTETAELVARHLDMIRVSLEEQGLKVDRLEVRNEMPGKQDDWQGMEQHNATREQHERREHLERLRRMGRLGEDAAPQAREMQSSGHTAEISGQGLHLVA